MHSFVFMKGPLKRSICKKWTKRNKKKLAAMSHGITFYIVFHLKEGDLFFYRKYGNGGGGGGFFGKLWPEVCANVLFTVNCLEIRRCLINPPFVTLSSFPQCSLLSTTHLFILYHEKFEKLLL